MSRKNAEINKLEEQFDAVDASMKRMTLDEVNRAPKEDVEMQTKLSQKEIENSKEIRLKPKREISSREPFNERFRSAWDYDKQYVQFIAENREIQGENIDLWTKPYAGVPAQEWSVPVNKPVWGPRFLAEQIKRKCYHRLVMENKIIENSGMGQMYGAMAVDTTVQRLDAHPVSSRKSVFMGSF